MIIEFQNDYRWLSNFAPVKITLGNIEYSSVEVAFLSAKSEDIEWKAFCSDETNTPGQVKKESRLINLIDNWETIKLDVMKECLIQKFTQEPYKSQLIATDNQHIQEGNNWNDKFWGVCLKTNEGQNNLGKLIMKIRQDLINQNTPS